MNNFCILCDKELSETELVQSLFFCSKCNVPKDEGIIKWLFSYIPKFLNIHHR